MTDYAPQPTQETLNRVVQLKGWDYMTLGASNPHLEEGKI